MEFSEEELEVIFDALEFVEDKYLNTRKQYLRDRLLEELAKKEIK